MQQSSSSIGALATALAKAQIELVNPEKSMIATIRSDDEAGADQVFRYAPLSSGLEILRKTLEANTAAWNGAPESSHNQVLEIIALFFREHPLADVNRVIHILVHEPTLQPIQLVLTAKSEPKIWREICVSKLLERYNNRLGASRRLA